MFYVVSKSHEVIDTFSTFEEAEVCRDNNPGSFIEYHVVFCQ